MTETQNSSPFTWRRTFPDTRHDFVAHDGAEPVGRIMRHEGQGLRPGPYWAWHANGVQSGRAEPGMAPLSGEADTRAEAIAALTAAWARAKAWSARTGRPLRQTEPASRADRIEWGEER